MTVNTLKKEKTWLSNLMWQMYYWNMLPCQEWKQLSFMNVHNIHSPFHLILCSVEWQLNQLSSWTLHKDLAWYANIDHRSICIHICTLTQNKYTHTHTHTHMHARTNTHTHIHVLTHTMRLANPATSWISLRSILLWSDVWEDDHITWHGRFWLDNFSSNCRTWYDRLCDNC